MDAVATRHRAYSSVVEHCVDIAGVGRKRAPSETQVMPALDPALAQRMVSGAAPGVQAASFSVILPLTSSARTMAIPSVGIRVRSSGVRGPAHQLRDEFHAPPPARPLRSSPDAE